VLAINTKHGAHILNVVSSVAVAWHALTWKSKGQGSRSHGYEKHHGRMTASEMWCCGHVLLLTGMGLHDMHVILLLRFLVNYDMRKYFFTERIVSFWNCFHYGFRCAIPYR